MLDAEGYNIIKCHGDREHIIRIAAAKDDVFVETYIYVNTYDQHYLILSV